MWNPFNPPFLPSCCDRGPVALRNRNTFATMGPPFQTNLRRGNRFLQASLVLPLYEREFLTLDSRAF